MQVQTWMLAAQAAQVNVKVCSILNSLLSGAGSGSPLSLLVWTGEPLMACIAMNTSERAGTVLAAVAEELRRHACMWPYLAMLEIMGSRLVLMLPKSPRLMTLRLQYSAMDTIAEEQHRADATRQEQASVMQHVQGDVAALRGEVGQLRGEMQGLQSEVQGLQSEVQGLQSEVQGKMQGLQGEMQGMRCQLTQLLQLLTGGYSAVREVRLKVAWHSLPAGCAQRDAWVQG